MKEPWEYASAAEEIEALKAELERLRGAEEQVERLRWSLKNADEDNDVLKAEVERLREEMDEWSADAREVCGHDMAEVERLRRSVDRRDATIERLREENIELRHELADRGLDRNDALIRLHRIEEAARDYLAVDPPTRASLLRLRAALEQDER